VLLIAIGASDGKVAIGRRYAFTHWVTPEVESEELVKEIVRRDYKRIALTFQEQEGAIACYKALLNELERRGLKPRVVLDEKFLPDSNDFRTFISKAKSRDAEAVVVALFPGLISAFAKQTRSFDLKADLIGFELFEDENEVKASEGALLGQWYVNADVAAGSFVDDYRKRFNEYPGWGAANGYDSLNITADAVQLFGPDTEKIVDYLHNLHNYSGAAGRYSASGDNRFNLPATIKVVREGGFEKLHKGP
jgi:branched-chain amino acid transport system substrate-binding protein